MFIALRCGAPCLRHTGWQHSTVKLLLLQIAEGDEGLEGTADVDAVAQGDSQQSSLVEVVVNKIIMLKILLVELLLEDMAVKEEEAEEEVTTLLFP